MNSITIREFLRTYYNPGPDLRFIKSPVRALPIDEIVEVVEGAVERKVDHENC